MVCKNLDLDLLGIDIVNDLGISFDAKTQQVFSISEVPGTLHAMGDSDITAFSTRIITAQLDGEWESFSTPVATISSPRHCHLTGDPALVTLNRNWVCSIALTNTAPNYINIGRNKFIGTVEQLKNVNEPWINSSTSWKPRPIASWPIKKSSKRPIWMCLRSSKPSTCSSFGNIPKWSVFLKWTSADAISTNTACTSKTISQCITSSSPSNQITKNLLNNLFENGSNCGLSEGLTRPITPPIFVCPRNPVKDSESTKISKASTQRRRLTNIPWRKSTNASAI